GISLSRPQRLPVPTFQVPSWNTDVPFWLDSRADPSDDTMLYVTVALVAEFTVTLVTLDPIPLARGSAAKALMAGSSVVPFCSSLTFSAMGVLELKNFSQFALICAAASAVDPVPGLLGAAELGGAGEAGETE